MIESLSFRFEILVIRFFIKYSKDVLLQSYIITDFLVIVFIGSQRSFLFLYIFCHCLKILFILFTLSYFFIPKLYFIFLQLSQEILIWTYLNHKTLFTIGLLDLMVQYADLQLQPFACIKYAITRVTLLDTPAIQCTNTLVF